MVTRKTFWKKTKKGAEAFAQIRKQTYKENGIADNADDIDMRIVTQFKGKRDNVREGTGILYLTSGGRIVQDAGWGEDFNSGNTPICTINELRHGFTLEYFIKKIQDARRKSDNKGC